MDQHSDQSPKLNELEFLRYFTILDRIAERLDVIPSPSQEQQPAPSQQNNEEILEIPKNKSEKSAKKSRFTQDQRLQIAIEAVREGNNSKVARTYKISEAAVRRCRESFIYNSDLQSVLGKRSKEHKATGKYPQMETLLLEWIQEQRQKKLSVCMKDIRDKAKILFAETYPESPDRFSASTGWFCRFIRRSNLSRRTPTHVVQQIRENALKDITSYLREITETRTKIEILRELGDFTETLIINIDEVPINLDLSYDKTYDTKGKKMIEVKKTTGTKQMLTALFGILSNGLKLPPYLVFKTKSAVNIPAELKPYLIARNGGGWMTADLFLDWLQRILFNLNLPEKTHVIFILDQAKVHATKNIIDALKTRKNISYFFVPAGCTFLLQPLDVCCNKPLKDRLKAQFHQWFQEQGCSVNNQTPAGYFRPPSYQLIMKWIVKELEALPCDIVRKSFKICGLSLKLDHEEDHLLNPRLSDHFQLDTELNNQIFGKNDPYTDTAKLLNELEKHQEQTTYEVSGEPLQENLSDSSSFGEPEEDNEEDFGEELFKLQIADQPRKMPLSSIENQVVSSNLEQELFSSENSLPKTIASFEQGHFIEDIHSDMAIRKKVTLTKKKPDLKQGTLQAFIKK